jgi:deoxycytidine triphosphate deaminase
MTQLCAASIANLCLGEDAGVGAYTRCLHPETKQPLPMISPFVPHKQVVDGKSYGLSAASYDLRIAHDLVLGPHPGHILALRLAGAPRGHPSVALSEMWQDIQKTPPCFALAHTLEDFAIPRSVAAYVCDKSTYARMGVSCFNTLFDPGFVGNGTLELVNLSDEPVVIKEGDPICQIIFHWLDHETDRPYAGKYQLQPKAPVAAILEGETTAALARET